MYKYATWDPTDLRQLFIPHAPPRLGERLAILKAVGRDGDALDAPLAPWHFGFGVEDVEDGRGGRGESRLEREEVVFPWTGLGGL